MQKQSTVREEDKLPGVFYNPKYTANGGKSNFATSETSFSFAQASPKLIQFLKKFVLGKWAHGTDAKGIPQYMDFHQYYRSPTPLHLSFFYQEKIQSGSFIANVNDKKANTSGWVEIYSGYVVAPFTGVFRFVGAADDALVVRFNQQVVLDYGYYSLSLGKSISDPSDITSGNTSKKGGAIFREKNLYDDFSAYRYTDIHLAKGVPISVTKGKVYPIEILFSDLSGGMFAMALFIEQLDANGKQLDEKLEKRLLLFRTTQELPRQSGSLSSFPQFNSNSPIWKVVDSRGKPIQKQSKTKTETRK